jgi:hypothetical protein
MSSVEAAFKRASSFSAKTNTASARLHSPHARARQAPRARLRGRDTRAGVKRHARKRIPVASNTALPMAAGTGAGRFACQGLVARGLRGRLDHRTSG